MIRYQYGTCDIFRTFVIILNLNDDEKDRFDLLAEKGKHGDGRTQNTH